VLYYLSYSITPPRCCRYSSKLQIYHGGSFVILSSNGAACGGIGVGVAVEVWCRGDVGGEAPSSLTLTVGWGWVGREPWVGCATPRLGIPVVYIES